MTEALLIEKLHQVSRTRDGSEDLRFVYWSDLKGVIRQHEAESMKHATGEPTAAIGPGGHVVVSGSLNCPADNEDIVSEAERAALIRVFGEVGASEFIGKLIVQRRDADSLGSPSKYSDGTYSREYEEPPVSDVKPGTLPIDISATLEALHTQYQFCADAIIPRASPDAPTLRQIGMIRDAHLNLIPILKEMRRLQKVEWCVLERRIDLTTKEPKLTPSDKHDIADKITVENRSKTDVVQDVYDALLEKFDLRRKL